MTNRTEIDVRDLTRVVFAGTSAYLAVHFVLLPQLVRWGVSFPAYFFVGVIATGALAITLSYVMRPRAATADMFPAE